MRLTDRSVVATTSDMLRIIVHDLARKPGECIELRECLARMRTRWPFDICRAALIEARERGWIDADYRLTEDGYSAA